MASLSGFMCYVWKFGMEIWNGNAETGNTEWKNGINSISTYRTLMKPLSGKKYNIETATESL